MSGRLRERKNKVKDLSVIHKSGRGRLLERPLQRASNYRNYDDESFFSPLLPSLIAFSFLLLSDFEADWGHKI